MNTQSHDDRVFIKDALPRLYAEIQTRLQRDWPDLLEQLQLLYLVKRCKCGLEGCVSFMCESADTRFAPVNGRRPLSYPLSGIHGWYSVSEDRVLAGFEILNDYADGYLNSRLVEAGLGSNTPLAKAAAEGQSKNAHDAVEGLSQPFENHTEGQEQSAPNRSIYTTPAATQHVIEYRLGVQAYSPEEIADFTEAAMAPTATLEATAVENVRHPSLLSVAMLEQKARMFKVRMPLKLIEGGLEVRTIVPEGIFQSPATPKSYEPEPRDGRSRAGAPDLK